MGIVNVSVLVTCFNKEPYLDEAIESVKRQTQSPVEVILVHDACNNPMAHVACTTIILPENRGVANARDVAFKFSKGEMVLFLDADDVISPDCLEKMVTVVKEKADIAYPDIYFWNKLKPELSRTLMELNLETVKKAGKLPIPVSSMMKRDVYEKLGGFRKMPVLEDLDFWVRALCNGYTFGKAETLFWYRQLPDSRNKLDLSVREEVLKSILCQIQ